MRGLLLGHVPVRDLSCPILNLPFLLGLFIMRILSEFDEEKHMKNRLSLDQLTISCFITTIEDKLAALRIDGGCDDPIGPSCKSSPCGCQGDTGQVIFWGST